MEKKLAEYRAAKQLEKLKDQESKSTKNISPPFNRLRNRSSSGTSSETEAELKEKLVANDEDSISLHLATKIHPDSEEPRLGASKSDVCLDRATVVLKIALWCALMVLFVKVEFGAVFFVVSCFYLIWTNFRKRPRQRGELSAYSVFNPNFEVLEGTLTAEQLERELKFGAVSVR